MGGRGRGLERNGRFFLTRLIVVTRKLWFACIDADFWGSGGAGGGEGGLPPCSISPRPKKQGLFRCWTRLLGLLVEAQYGRISARCCWGYATFQLLVCALCAPEKADWDERGFVAEFELHHAAVYNDR